MHITKFKLYFSRFFFKKEQKNDNVMLLVQHDKPDFVVIAESLTSDASQICKR
jgi:hypothetical protein